MRWPRRERSSPCRSSGSASAAATRRSSCSDLLLPLSSGQFEGLGRYCSVLFPLPILFGSLRGETRHLGLMTGFVMFYTLGLVLFGNVHPLF